jgi:hypothetical protein
MTTYHSTEKQILDGIQATFDKHPAGPDGHCRGCGEALPCPPRITALHELAKLQLTGTSPLPAPVPVQPTARRRGRRNHRG